ncbi:hypothetical protein EMCRGX_G007319 [Ephydatia muelleri]
MVNPQLEPHRYPMPLPDDLIRKFSSGYGFSKIDAFNQLMASRQRKPPSQMIKDGDQVVKVAAMIKVGTPCYALYFGLRRDKDPRHLEQLRSRYTSQEDAEPSVSTPNEEDQSTSRETPEVSVKTDQRTEPVLAPALPKQKGGDINPRQPTGDEYGPEHP